MDRECDPRFRTLDGMLIVDGLRVWDYDWQPGTVCFAETRIDEQRWDGWFQILRDGAGTKTMNGERLWTVHPTKRIPPPPFADDRASGLRRAALNTGAVLTVEYDSKRQRCPRIEWAPRVATDPQPWLDTVSGWRYFSAEVMPYACDYCDRPATLRAKDSDDVLCEWDARDHYADWRDATRALTAREVADRLDG
jgi:hypothetical protein